MQYSCQLFSVLAVGAVLAMSTSTSAQPSPVQPSAAQAQSSNTVTPKPAPIFIVSARTEPVNQPTPAYDLSDLERYFVGRLGAQGVKNVAPKSAAKDPKSPNVYLVELSVDALQAAYRTEKAILEPEKYTSDPLLQVDLTLQLRDSDSKQMIGRTGESREYHISAPELPERQKAHLYQTADDLAQRFVEEWASGKYGDALPASQAPTFLERAPWWLLLLLLGAGVLALLTVFYILARIFDALFSPRRRPSQVPVQTVPDPPTNYAAWDQELQEAFALSFETNGFDEAVCQAVAYARCDEILASHEAIEAKEAKRVVSTKLRDIERAKIATYAISRCDLDTSDIIETLRGAEEWPYRVLQEAKKLCVEVAQSD